MKLQVPSGTVANPYPSNQHVASVLDSMENVRRDFEGSIAYDDESGSESDASQPDNDMEVLQTAIGAHYSETEAVGGDINDISEDEMKAAGMEKRNALQTIQDGVQRIMRATERPGKWYTNYCIFHSNRYLITECI